MTTSPNPTPPADGDGRAIGPPVSVDPCRSISVASNAFELGAQCGHGLLK